MNQIKRSRQEWIRRYVSFVFILFIIAFGTSLSIRANLGSSPISAPPYVLSLAIGHSPWSMGVLTMCMHVFFILAQIVLLRKEYEMRQLSQILVSFLFGFYTDVTMWMTGFLQVPFSMDPLLGYPLRLIELLTGGALLAFGIACEVRCDSLMLAGEGFPLAIAKFLKKDFGKVKMFSDTGLVCVGVVIMICFFGRWDWKMIGVGTLISMFYVGYMVRLFAPHISWLDRVFIPSGDRQLQSSGNMPSVSAAQSSPLVITIAREYGSGGGTIGEMVAQRLGIELYDRNIIDDTASELGYTAEFVEKNEQNISNGKLWELIFTDKSIPASMNPSHDDAIYVNESRIIRRLACEKSCVIIGRCANWLLRDDKNVFRVFVTSDEDYAANKIMIKEGLSEEEARKRIQQVNTGRSNHYFQYTGRHWTDARDYDLVVNTSKVGMERAIQIIVESVSTHSLNRN